MVAGHLQEKNGYFYIVLNYKDETGKRHSPWFPTKLPVKGNKKRAEAMLAEMRQSFQVPQTPAETLTAQAADDELLFVDYLKQWLVIAKHSVKLTTYASYANLSQSVIIPYFEKKGYTLKGLTAKNIQDFYIAQLERVSACTVIHYHAIIHRALRHAVRQDIINSNPADKIERPRKEKYIGSFYTSAEINELFDCIEGHILEVPIKLATFYGLRKSELLGLRWSAIDFERNTITISHTVTTCTLDGKHVEVVADTTKTKSSLRTLPLTPAIRTLLLRKLEEQAHYRKLCGRSYCKDYLDYICVNEIGERFSPNNLYQGFKRILRENKLRDIRFHDLRHSCASLLLANRIPMKMIQEWLGHSDFATTANLYAHLEYESKLTSADAMQAVLNLPST